MKILIADDDAVARRLLELLVRRLGHEPIVVTNGLDAGDVLLAPDGPCFAILDWRMPGLDGLAVCRAVRRRVTPYVYIVLVTAADHPDEVEEALAADVDDVLRKPLAPGELEARVRSGERLLKLQETLLEAQATLHYQASHDHLTGVWNRARIEDHLRAEIGRTQRGRTPIAVLLADVDHFKQVNDGYGHLVGDAVLREATGRLRLGLRAYDAIGRYGGEEFLIVLPDCDTETALAIAERARACVAAPVYVGGVAVSLSVSLGVASSEMGLDNPDALIQAADEALYRAKARGRNCVDSLGLLPRLGPEDALELASLRGPAFSDRF